jgi:CheY-like chemotaxis protein
VSEDAVARRTHAAARKRSSAGDGDTPPPDADETTLAADPAPAARETRVRVTVTQPYARGVSEAKGKKILVADDERAVADLLATALAQEGYETRRTIESLRFIDAVRDMRPNLILLDLRMPYLNGEDELRLLRMFPDTAEIPVIVVTADIEARTREPLYRSLGVVEMVFKPFDLDRLVRLVHDLMR